MMKFLHYECQNHFDHFLIYEIAYHRWLPRHCHEDSHEFPNHDEDSQWLIPRDQDNSRFLKEMDQSLFQTKQRHLLRYHFWNLFYDQ